MDKRLAETAPLSEAFDKPREVFIKDRDLQIAYSGLLFFQRRSQFVISDDLAHGRRPEEMEKAVREGLLIHDYVNAEIGIGKFAELMQLNYEEARDWLHQYGIATSRQFTDPALEQAEGENYRKIARDR